MPKYVTLDWHEYERLQRDLKTTTTSRDNLAGLRDQLIPLVEKPENMEYYTVFGRLPPIGWRPVTNEQIVERLKEKLGVQ